MDEETIVRFESREDAAAALAKKEGLSGADFSGLDLSEMKIAAVDMGKAKFQGANLANSQLAAGNFEGCDFSGANLNEARIAAVNLSGAFFAGAKMRGAKLAASNMEKCDMTGADLSDSRWFGVNVSGADFSDVETVGARSGGVSWSSAKVPPAEKPQSASVSPAVPAAIIGAVLVVLGLIVLLRRMRVED